jgi:hypothetical protein
MLSWFPEFWSLLFTFKNIEGHFALVSNLEQPITTLKSRMELSPIKAQCWRSRPLMQKSQPPFWQDQNDA